MSNISEIFTTDERTLDRFLQEKSDKEFMLLAKRLIVCVLANKQNLLNEADSSKFERAVNISNFERMISGEDFELERKKKVGRLFEEYKLTYSNLCLIKIVMEILSIKQRETPEDIRTFLENHPKFEEENSEMMTRLEIECNEMIEKLKLMNIPLFEDLVDYFQATKNHEYTYRVTEFYKSEYYNNKSFEFFYATIGQIYMNDYSKYTKAKRQF